VEFPKIQQDAKSASLSRTRTRAGSLRLMADHASEPEQQDEGNPGTVSTLACPRCGLRVTPRTPLLMIEYCPRCIGRARTAVKLRSVS
jgi:hypothetical protein